VIAVLADDYTGAAEVGGIALRYGLAAQVQTHFHADTATDLVVVDTDTRALSPAEAACVVGSVARQVAAARPEWVFKKVDSLLRGPVAVEVESVRTALGYALALLVAGNPHSGRLIRGGLYTVSGRPLAETEFAHDPEHPATSSRVLDLLAPAPCPIACVRPGEQLPDAGLAVAEVTCACDLERWAQALPPDALPAGSAVFLAALLAARGYQPSRPKQPSPPQGPMLLVSGSQSDCSLRNLDQMAAHLPILEMPAGLCAGQSDDRLIAAWVAETARALARQAKAVMAIRLLTRPCPGVPERLCASMAQAVAGVLSRIPVAHLLVVGGATASAIMRRQGWTQAAVVGEHAPGVVSLHPGGQAPLVTTKPGSYPWPEGLLPG